MLALTVSFTGCAGELDLRDDDCEDDDLDYVDGLNIGRTFRGLAHPGRWIPPPEVLAAGDRQRVEFTDAPPFDGGANCSGGPTPGASMLRTHLLEYFPQTARIGIYNCRVIDGTSSMSLHGVGRALDIMIPTVRGDADNDLGDPIAHWLIENAEAIGVQTIIWDHSIWRTSNVPRQRELRSGSPHVDHLHVELSVAGARKQTSWYDAPFGPTPTTPFVGCEPLPASGGVVEEDGPCFELHGPSQFWRTESGAGSGGALLWTNAFDSRTPSNHAEWKLPVSSSGRYALAAYLDPAHAQFVATRYVLRRGSEGSTLLVDQSRGRGWFDLGTYLFSAADANTLHVHDDHDGPVGTRTRIVADAVRLTALTGTTTAEPPPDEPPPEEPPADDGVGRLEPPELTEPPVLEDESGAEVRGLTRLSSDAVSGGCSAATPDGSLAPLLALLPLLARAGSRRARGSRRA